jgi:uncharacterized membrane protein
MPSLAVEDFGTAFSVTADGLFSGGGVSSNFNAVKFNHLLQTKTDIVFQSNYWSTVYKITPDGNTMVGEYDRYLNSDAFIKTGTDAYELLGSVNGPSPYNYTMAFDVSDDGKVVVGESRGAVFRWTRNTGMVALGPTLLSSGYRIVSISGNGQFIVGNSYSPAEGVEVGGFIWDASNGLRDLKAVIESRGVNLVGWFLSSVTAISADGNVIAGEGVYDYQGVYFQRAWMVRGLSQTPQPTISINKEANQYVVRFSGVLQESDDLGILDSWQDVVGNPTIQYTVPSPLAGRKFYRARSN